MKENIKLGLRLLIITAVAGLCLGIANNMTADAIAANSKVSQSDLAVLLPGSESIKDIEVKDGDSEGTNVVTEAYEISGKDDVIGYVMKVKAKGFHGPIEMLVAIKSDDSLSGIKIVSQQETPGLGNRIGEGKFADGFKNKEIKSGISMVKTETEKNNEVEAISGASISSRAVGAGVNTAITFYIENVKGEKADFQNNDATSGASEG